MKRNSEKARSRQVRLVDLSPYAFVLEPRYYFYGWCSSPQQRLREPTLKALLRARSFLPRGYNFKIWDGQRPYSVQAAMVESFRRRLKFVYPHRPPTQIERLLLIFGGRPLRKETRLDTHRNGGSVDLTIVDAAGNELPMGTDHDDLTPKAALAYFEKRHRLNLLEKMARRNRRLLKSVMQRAGFVGYAPEWWHWSYRHLGYRGLPGAPFSRS
jgi:D-alanyl-D-alanine dipeptidase